MKLDLLIQLGKKISFLVPVVIESRLIRFTQRIVFRRALNEFIKLNNAKEFRDELIDRLIYGWGNQGFSAHREYLQQVIKYAYNTKGPVLECGTGLSTILLGIIGQKTGNRVYSLEHDDFWCQKVTSILNKFKIANVEIFVNNLKNYGDFEWYDPPVNSLPDKFNIVICDGPPSFTRGGRYGLIPVMKDRLAGGIILLDDYSRKAEQIIVKKWQNDYNLSIHKLNKNETYIILIIS